jgi:hypothetical protein
VLKTVVCTLGQPGVQVFLATSGRRVQEVPGQPYARRWVTRYSGVLDQLRGDASGPPLTVVCTLGQQGDQVFLASSGGRVQEGPGQQNALRWVNWWR